MNYHHHRNYQWEGSGLPQILESRGARVQLLKILFLHAFMHTCVHMGAHTLITHIITHTANILLGEIWSSFLLRFTSFEYFRVM